MSRLCRYTTYDTDRDSDGQDSVTHHFHPGRAGLIDADRGHACAAPINTRVGAHCNAGDTVDSRPAAGQQKPRRGGVENRPCRASTGQPFTHLGPRLCLYLRMFTFIGYQGISCLPYPRIDPSRHGYALLALFDLILQDFFPREKRITHYHPPCADVEFAAHKGSIVQVMPLPGPLPGATLRRSSRRYD